MANINGMLNTTLNGLQLYRSQYYEGLIDENQISQMLQYKPYEVSQTLSYIFGFKDQQSVLDGLTGGTGRTMQIDKREYEWNIMIEAEKPVVIEAATWNGSAISAADTPGIANSVIQIWTVDNFFAPGTIVEFDNKNFQARIMSEPYQDGHLYVYSLQVSSSDPSAFIPPSLLAQGRQLSRLGSAYEEGSDEADKINYQTPIKLRNQLTTMRMEYRLTGSAKASVMIVEMREPNSGKVVRYWDDYQYWLALREWYKRIDYQLVYEQYNAAPDGTVALKGTNGRPVYRGAGLLQQISPANKEYYTKLTADLLEDFLYNLSYNVLGMGERKFVALTGEMGMKELDRVLREKASALSLIDTKFVSGSGQELTLGGQFTTYKMLNGVELTLKHFPVYDDLYHNRNYHPVSGKPAESYRMTFINFGITDGESNIQKVVRAGREMEMWVVAGSFIPNVAGASKSMLRATSKDESSVQILGECGIMIKNPTTCGELILDVDNL